MSIRSNVTAGTWQNIGTGPALVQVISPDATGVSVMVANQTAQPSTNSDGLVLGAANPVLLLTLAQAIWAQVEQTGETAIVAVQPQAVGG
jgi:hypothetical protein